MLTTFFLFCAVVGGVVMVCQFAMTLMGMGDDADGMDADFDGAGDVDVEHGSADHSSSWLFGVISFRTLVAATAFFGLGGYAAQSAGQPAALSLVIAFASGGAAMYSVYGLLRSISRLQADGTQQIRNALGGRGSVLVPIPPGNSGVGKIQLKLQGRLVELPAVNAGEQSLATGRRVEVVEVLGPGTVRVEPTLDVTPSSEISKTGTAANKTAH